MPRYTYRCRTCVREFEVFHGMSEKLENCDECSGVLFRVPSTTFTTTKTSTTEKPGQVVKEFIQDAKEEIEAEKQLLEPEIDEYSEFDPGRHDASKGSLPPRMVKYGIHSIYRL